MTPEKIIEWAREAGFEYAVDNERWYCFAALVAAHEREACANVCDEVADNAWSGGEAKFAGACAAAIRAREMK